MNKKIFILLSAVTLIFQRQYAMELSNQNPNCIKKLLNEPVQEYLCYRVKFLRFKHTITPLNIRHFIDADLKRVFAQSDSNPKVLHNLAEKKFKADAQDIKQLVMRLLCGANPDKIYHGNSFINYAIMFDQPQILAFLLGAGANSNSIKSEGFLYDHDPLSVAITHHNITCVRLLLLGGAVICEKHLELAKLMSSKFDKTILFLLSGMWELWKFFKQPISIFSVDEEKSLSLVKTGYQEIVEECEEKLERLILGPKNRFEDKEEPYQARGYSGGLWQKSVSSDDLEWSSSSSDSPDSEEDLSPSSRPLKKSVRGLLKEYDRSDTNDGLPDEGWQPMFTYRYTRGGFRLWLPPGLI